MIELSSIVDINSNGVISLQSLVHTVRKEYAEEIKSFVKMNKTSSLPPGSRLFFPKHVTFSRGRFRHFGEKNKVSITRKKELATHVVIDSFWLYEMFNRFGNSEVLELNNVKRIMDYQWNSDLKRKYSIIDRHTIVSSGTVTNDTNFEDLLDIAKNYSDVRVLTYNQLNNLISDQKIESWDEYLRIVGLTYSDDEGMKTMGLNFLSALNQHKYGFLIYVALAHHFSPNVRGYAPVRRALSKVMYSNIGKRFMAQFRKKHMNSWSINSWDSYLITNPYFSSVENALIKNGLWAIRELYKEDKFFTKAPQIPVWFSRVVLKHSINDTPVVNHLFKVHTNYGLLPTKKLKVYTVFRKITLTLLGPFKSENMELLFNQNTSDADKHEIKYMFVRYIKNVHRTFGIKLFTIAKNIAKEWPKEGFSEEAFARVAFSLIDNDKYLVKNR